LAVVSLSACSWFGHHKAPPPPKPTEILVTGAPLGSLVFIDGVQAGTPATRNDHSQVLDVAPGTHIVEVHLGDTVVYHEDTYVAAGQRRSVIVLSGSTR
jgi:hypothetical protein